MKGSFWYGIVAYSSICLSGAACLELDPLPFLELDEAVIVMEEFRSVQVAASLNGRETFRVSQAGFIFSANQEIPTLGHPDVDSIVVKRNFTFVEGDRTFSTVLSKLAVPPHHYWIRSFLQYDGHVVYSHNTESIQFGDGWQLDDQRLPARSWSMLVQALGEKIYFGIGCPELSCGPFNNDRSLWAFDPVDGTVAAMASFPGDFRQRATAFVLNDQLFFGLGSVRAGNNVQLYSDLWSFTPDGQGGYWKVLAPFPGGAREGAVSFVIDDRTYLGLGHREDSTLTDWYRFDGVAWDRLQPKVGDVDDLKRFQALSFSHRGKGYVMMGRRISGSVRDLWEYTPDAEGGNWSKIENVNIPSFRDGMIHLDVQGDSFVGLGVFNNTYLSDWYAFTPSQSQKFSSKADLPANGRAWLGAASWEGIGYILGGLNNFGRTEIFNDIWQYIPNE